MDSTPSINFTESQNPVKKAAVFQLLWEHGRAYKPRLAMAAGAVVAAAGAVLAFGWGIRSLVDHGFAQGHNAVLDRALVGLLMIILVLAAASYTRFYNVYWLAERMTADLRKKIFTKLLAQNPAYFDDHKTGDEVARINADTTVLHMAAATNLPTSFRHLITLIGGVSLLLVVSPVMTGLVLLVVPIVVAPIIFFGRRVRKKSRDTQSRVGDVSAYSHEALQSLQTIQSFGYESHSLNYFSAACERVFETAQGYIKIRAFLTAFVICTVFGAVGLVLMVGGHKVLAGMMSAGDLTAFVFYAVVVAGAVGSLSEAASAFHQATGAADRILSLLHLPDTDGQGVDLPQTVKGSLKFERVSFAYPARLSQPALKDVSFSVPAGKTVALLGASGAGKTTVFQLLQRFYEPAAGSIYIDSFHLKDYAPMSTRQAMAVVSQDPAIFSMSIADNIRMGKPSASDAEVKAAAQLAQADDFIMQLPQGYNTSAGERGGRLSGGQKQRIAIARAILKDSPILLLDEATSALDATNEQAVHLALKNLMKGRTTLIIAHHFATIQNADWIVVLDQGQVVAEGTHEHLYKKNALYTDLAGTVIEKKAS